MSPARYPPGHRETTASAEAAAARVHKRVDAAAVRANLAVLRAASGGRHVMAVVKGDAYGLGAPALSGVLAEAGVEALAVDTVAEGVELREHGVRLPVLVMDVDVPGTEEVCAGHGLMPSVSSREQVERHALAAVRGGTPCAVWLRANVGFNRFGPREEQGFADVVSALDRQRHVLRAEGVFAHLSSSADDPEETAEQSVLYRARLEHARRVLGAGLRSSLAATHGLAHPLALEGTAWVRPGIGLYGLTQPRARELPGWAASGLGRLRPAVSVRARVMELREVTRAEGLGYDRRARVPHGRVLASVAVGFARGLAPAAGAFTGVLRGRGCPMVGRPGMDCAQFDVTEVPGAAPGDWMTLLGPAAPEDGGGERAAPAVCAELGRTVYALLPGFRAPVRLHHTAQEKDLTGTAAPGPARTPAHTPDQGGSP